MKGETIDTGDQGPSNRETKRRQTDREGLNRETDVQGRFKQGDIKRQTDTKDS